jgi:hypothetical protein
MYQFDRTGEHKRRTRGHVIEEMSLNFLERKVLERGHQLVPATRREYGWDATMFHFSPDTGGIENGEVCFQLKATDHLIEGKPFAVCKVSTKDLHYWYWEAQRFPFVLVLYDAQKNRAYWLDIRQFIDDVLFGIDVERQSIQVQIPWTNKVTVRTIDRLRGMSLSRMAREG